ncbi:MAG: peptide ABC transporter substrate-binding protein [Pseudonocardiales bacterium]|nr:MAG: peptide ABC transporter substrate-binding protein [Pseudonocardiales bacterium]
MRRQQAGSVMRHGRLRRAGAALLGLGVVAVSALVGGGAPAGAASNPILKIASDTELTTFNPFTSYYDGELNIIAVIYPSLTVGDSHNVPQPYLAKSWSHSPDNKTWTFPLRTGLKWTDGKPITAQDVTWTYNLVMHNDAAASANGSLVTNFASVTAPNASTVVIKTKTPQGNIPYVSLPVVPQHVWASRVKNIAKELNTEMPVVGYGPWRLTAFKTDQFATMKPNKDFMNTGMFKGAPKYSELISYYFKSSDASVAALRTGALDQLTGMTPTEFKALAKVGGIKTYRTAPVGWTAVEVNPGARTKGGQKFGTANPALADQRLRAAIAYSFNRPLLVSRILDGLGDPGASYIPTSYPEWAWKPSAGQAITYNPTKANQILDQAGYRKGSNGVRIDPKTNKPLNLRLGIHSDDDQDAQISQYLVQWLKAIGIHVTIQSLSFDALNKNLVKGDWDMLMDGWSTGADPTYLLSIQTCGALPPSKTQSGSTDAFYCNKSYDKLFAAQLSTSDLKARAANIRAMQSILYTANIDIILYYKDQISGLRTNSTSGYLTGSPDSNGVYPLQNHFVNWSQAAPVDAKSSNHTATYIGVIVAVVVVVALVAAILLRRRSTAAERE